MKRLRDKVTALFILLGVSGIAGTAIVTTRIFVADQRSYVMELNSIAAPNVGAAIGRHFDHLYDQLVVADEILGSLRAGGEGDRLLRSAFEKLIGIRQLDVYDDAGLLASIGAAREPDSALPKEVGQVLKNDRDRSVVARPRASGGRPETVIALRVRAHTYLATVDAAFFAEDFEAARALAVSVVDADGKTLAAGGGGGGGGTGTGAAGGTGGAGGAGTGAGASAEEAIPPERVSDLHQALRSSERQSVIAREIESEKGDRWLVAMAPIPGTRGALVVVRATSAQAGAMFREVLRRSIPFLVALLIVAAATGFTLASQVARPIERLTEATSRIASGQWDVQVRSRGKDEVARLVGAFRRMGEELAKRESALKKAHEDLLRSEKLASLGQFSAGLAHEVKNPLNVILGYAQLIQMKWAKEGDPEHAKYVGFIMDETRRASKIITDLLTFARQKPPVTSRTQANELVSRAMELLGPQAQAANVELSREDAGAASIWVEVDKDQIYQILLNLVTNAIQAMEEKPPGETRKITLRLLKVADQAAIEVEDTGPGIPPDVLARLFEPFFSTKGVGRGTGLGLSLCHGIAVQHRGKIEVSSIVGRGTTFRLLLPAVA